MQVLEQSATPDKLLHRICMTLALIDAQTHEKCNVRVSERVHYFDLFEELLDSHL